MNRYMTKKSKTLFNSSDFCTSLENMKFDKNTIIGLLLMLLLAFGFSWYSANKAAKEQELNQQASAANQDTQSVPAAATQTPQPNTSPVINPDQLVAANTERYASLAPAALAGSPSTVTLKNQKVTVQLQTKGGHIHKAQLNEFNQYNSENKIQLWDTSNTAMNLNWKNAKGELVQSSELYFEPSVSEADASAQKAEVRMRAKGVSDSQYLEWVYTLEPNSYQVKCELHVVGLENEILQNPLQLDWKLHGIPNEKGLQTERSKSSIFFREQGEDRDYLSETSNDSQILEKPLHWVDMKQDYFSVALVSDNGFDKGDRKSVV